MTLVETEFYRWRFETRRPDEATAWRCWNNGDLCQACSSKLQRDGLGMLVEVTPPPGPGLGYRFGVCLDCWAAHAHEAETWLRPICADLAKIGESAVRPANA